MRIFTANRSLTGMRIEQYAHPASAVGTRWVDELARRLGGLGVTRVTIYSSAIVAEAPDWSARAEQAEEAIRDLYIYYVDGQIPEGDYTGEEPEGGAVDPETATA